MKKLLLLLTTFIALACNGQTPAIKCYSQFQWDSITSVLNVLQVENNQLLQFNSNVSLQLVNKVKSFDSVMVINENLIYNLSQCVNPTDTLVYFNDTIDFKLIGQNNTVTVSKKGEQINYQITAGLHRLNIFYNDYQFRTYLMYDKGTYDSWLSTFAIPVK
jgi:hypothetical protein